MLIGRDAEVQAIDSVLRRASEGRGSLVIVEGDAGMGKTSVVQAALDATSVPIEVAWGSAWEEGAPGLWPWTQILRRLRAPADLLDRVHGGNPGPAGQDPEGERFRLLDDVCELLLASDRAVRVLVVDDLHWADPTTVALLRTLGRRLRDRSVVTIACYRRDEVESSVRNDLIRHAELVSLGGLRIEDVGELLRAVIATGVTATQVEDVCRRTGGNPFFVSECGRLAAASGSLDGVPAGVGEVLERRLARLPQSVVEVLTVVAAAGPAADVDVVAEVSGSSRAAVLDYVETARQAGIARAVLNGKVDMVHALFRDVLLDGLGVRRSAALHLAIGRALVRRRAAGHSVPAAALAEQLLRGAAAGGWGEAALAAAAAGDDALAQLAYQEAAGWFERAVAAIEATSPVDQRRRLELATAWGDALWRAGDGAGARMVLVAAADGARAVGLADLLPRLAYTLGRVATMSTVPDVELRSLLVDALAVAPPGAMRARLLASLARCDYHQGSPDGDLARVLALADEAVAEARAAEDADALSFCLMARHDAVWRPGTALERVALASEVARVAVGANDLDTEVEAHLLRYTALLEIGEHPNDDAFQDFARSAGRSRQPRHRYLVTSRWATRALLSGRYRDAETLIADAARQARRLGDPDGPVVELNQRWELLSDLGRRPEALETLEIFSAYSAHPFIWLALALARDAAGDGAGAQAAFAMCTDIDVAALRPPYAQPWVAALLVEAALAFGRIDVASEAEGPLLTAAGTAVVMGGGVLFHGAADHHLGLLYGRLGRRQEAINQLRAGEGLHRRIGAVPWLARSQVALGQLVGGDEGAQLLESAAVLATGVGMALSVPTIQPNRLIAEGDGWSLHFRGRVLFVRDSKGMRDLAVLLAQPGSDVGARQLYGGEAAAGADPVLDEPARRAYAARLARLDEAAAEADRRGDVARSAAVSTERGALLQQLRAASGLGGRTRSLGDPAERARKAVAARLRDAIGRISALDGALGAHLDASVTTGTWCAYRPIPPEIWSISGRADA